MASQDPSAELLTAIDERRLTEGEARGLQSQGADLEQGLAHALATEQVKAVLILAHGCGTRLSESDDEPKNKDVMRYASRGDWPTVAYYLASNEDVLRSRLRAKDIVAEERLQKMAGGIRVLLPEDYRKRFRKSGKLPKDVFVEQYRWLNPKPRKDQCFLTTEGKRLEEGWYTVVEYPLSDDLREGMLRRKFWGETQHKSISTFLQNTGETLLCKAVKAGQWELVEWMLEQSSDDAQRLAQQVKEEFAGVWEGVERHCIIQTAEELDDLCDCLDSDGFLDRAWRHGVLEVPIDAELIRPEMDTLCEAAASDDKPLEQLQKNGEAVVTFAMPQSRAARRCWLADVKTLGVNGFAVPLQHRAILAGRLEVLQMLLREGVAVDEEDPRGLSALALASTEGKWEAASLLLEEGCRADGRSGAIALAAAEKASRSPDLEIAEQATSVLERIHEQQRRPPASSLADYFRRQARGELVHGIHPCRFSVSDAAFVPRGGGRRIWVRAMELGTPAEDSEVVFVPLDADSYEAAVASGTINLAGKKMSNEDKLVHDAIAVVVPAGRVSRSGEMLKIIPAGGGPLAEKLPVIARAPKAGGIRVRSCSHCCNEPIAAVEVHVDGVRLGETGEPRRPHPDEPEECVVHVLVPPRELEVTLELSGRKVHQETIVGSADAEISATAGLAILVYVLLVDEDEGLEFVFVCGHRRNVPEDAKPFIGKVQWCGGSLTLSGYELVVMGSVGCLQQLQSLALLPDMPPGKEYEAVPWEDTGACQYQRCLFNPVRVGKIFKPE